jgi:hypothetical protein
MLWTDGARGRNAPASQRLGRLVGDLVRARRRQQTFSLACEAVLWSLVAAVLATLAQRLWLPDAPIVWASAACLCLGLSATLTLTWWRRPDPLRVAIAADIQLRMKQRLSTAWERVAQGRSDELTERLAERAFRARLPTRPSFVFPLRWGAAAALTPIAALALVLVATFELQPIEHNVVLVVDEQVVAEGALLGEHGRRLEAKARRGALGRAERQARRMQQLGERMQSGLLSRPEALDRLNALGEDLDRERLAALREGIQSAAPALRVRQLPSPRGGAAGIADLRSALERLLKEGGEPSASERRGLESLGLSEQELREALDGLEQGDRQKLEDIIKGLADLERSAEESEALDQAGDAVERAQRNLGDDRMAENDAPTPGGERPGTAESPGGLPGAPGDQPGDDFGDGDAGTGSAPGNEVPSDRFVRGEEPTGAGEQLGAMAAIKPQGQLGEGEVFTSQVRVLPQLNDATATAQLSRTDFQAQAEAVMSEQAYPPHQKAFLRRYFLNLSEGVDASTSQARENRVE